MAAQSFILVLGGAASGKSAFAESLCLKADGPRHYIATAQAFDDEMRDKITRHQARRDAGWTTIEAPLDLAPALASFGPKDVVLLDCVTLWLSNHLLAESALETEFDTLLQALAQCRAETLVLVSNEVGHGVVPDTALGRRFRAAQGQLNQLLAQAADRVALVTAGLPLLLKGA